MPLSYWGSWQTHSFRAVGKTKVRSTFIGLASTGLRSRAFDSGKYFNTWREGSGQGRIFRCSPFRTRIGTGSGLSRSGRFELASGL